MRMKIIYIGKAVRVSVIAALGLFGGIVSDVLAERPNILFIYTDDQSFRTLGSYAEQGARQWVDTPHIDRLAEEGVRFTTAYGGSWCSPSRASVLTGLLPHGIEGVDIVSNQQQADGKSWAVEGSAIDRDTAQMWPQVLRNAGYNTAMVGKWHLGQDAGHGWLWDHSVVWDQNTPKGDWYNDQSLSIDGGAPQVVPGYSTDVYTEFAVDYIEQSHDEPWFLWLNYNAPHLPNTVHPRHADLYRTAEVPIPDDIFGPRENKPDYMRDRTMFRKNPEGGDPIWWKWTLPEMVRGYNRLVSSIDEGVGELLEALEKTGQLDNTLVVFTSDQGMAWGEHGFAWKVGPYDACLKMPLIFRLPGKVKPGGVVDQAATILDVVPTLLGFAEVELPWEMHGYDLRPLLEEPTMKVDRLVYMEHFHSHFGAAANPATVSEEDATWKGVPWWMFLMDGRFKYIRTLASGQVEELYDLELDPNELKNLAVDPAYDGKLKEYRKALALELKRTDYKYLDTILELDRLRVPLESH